MNTDISMNTGNLNTINITIILFYFMIYFCGSDHETPVVNE
jgi:hypothetical protein